MTSAQAARTALDEMGTKGEFVRKDSDFRSWVKSGSEYPPEGRLCLCSVLALMLSDMSCYVKYEEAGVTTMGCSCQSAAVANHL